VSTAAVPRTNWAGNIAYGAPDFESPASMRELQTVVARARQVRVLATGHSFNDMADTTGVQVSLAGLPPEIEIDSAAGQVRVAAGLSYAQLAGYLDDHGFALRNLASLPHISVAGACATGTHGSGPGNQNLAASVRAMEVVTAGGDVVELRRGDDAFAGTVVHLGALGVVSRVVLEVVPSFEVSQRVYENLPLDVLDDYYDDIMAAGYSVSLFTDWREPRLTQAWFKQRLAEPGAGADDGPPPVAGEPWFSATPAQANCNPVPGLTGENCTEQLGVPGPWYQRLPHFRPEFTPSAGDELQSEYLLPAGHAVQAIKALRQIAATMAPVLMVCEFRRVAADDLWLSACYRQDSAAFHFTWIRDIEAVRPVVTELERQLAPFGARPHWGKVFTTPPERIAKLWPHLPDFVAAARTADPGGKFRNAFLDRYVFA
jgi:xylitol oxidase